MNLLKPFSSRSFMVGVGIAALAYLLAPSLKKGARVVAVKGMQGAMMAGEAASNAVATGRERMAGMMHGISERAQDSGMVQNVLDEMKNEREQLSNTLQEMMNTMKNMQEEIALLKEGNKGTV